MRFTLLCGALLLVATGANAQGTKARIDRGPAQGMMMGDTVSKDGEFDLVSLEPSLPGASPVPDSLRATVDALLAGDRSKDYAQAGNAIASGAVTRFCPLDENTECEADRPFDGFGVPEADRANTPYYLSDGRVRIEWLKGTEVRFLSFLAFSGGKLTRVETAPAIMPMKREG